MAGKKTDGPDSPSVKIIVNRLCRLKCKLASGGAENVIRCINCNDIAEGLFSLKCTHNLCGDCFFRCIPYTCVDDGIHTDKGQQVSPIFRVNKALTSTAIQCPECGHNLGYPDFQEHVENCQRNHHEATNLPNGKEAVANSEVQTTQDDNEALKITLQQLEKRIEALELPLSRLIQRLSKKM